MQGIRLDCAFSTILAKYKHTIYFIYFFIGAVSFSGKPFRILTRENYLFLTQCCQKKRAMANNDLLQFFLSTGYLHLFIPAGYDLLGDKQGLYNCGRRSRRGSDCQMSGTQRYPTCSPVLGTYALSPVPTKGAVPRTLPWEKRVVKTIWTVHMTEPLKPFYKPWRCWCVGAETYSSLSPK